MKPYIVGMCMIGVVIGLLTGASSSPVVAVILPLLFTLMTAGGNFYVVWGERQREADATTRERSARAGFLGWQLSLFALGCLAGLWTGILAKLRPDLLWPVQVGRPAYAAMTPSPTFESLPVYRHLDSVLVSDGVPYSQRLDLLHKLQIPADVLSQVVTRVSSARDFEIPSLEAPTPPVPSPSEFAGGDSNALPAWSSPKVPAVIANRKESAFASSVVLTAGAPAHVSGIPPPLIHRSPARGYPVLAWGTSNAPSPWPSPKWPDIIANLKDLDPAGNFVKSTNWPPGAHGIGLDLLDLQPATNRSHFGPAARHNW